MATAEQVADLRRLIDEPTQDPYTDAILGVRIDAHGDEDLRLLASTLWREKAARFAGLVDVQEGNSRRNLSQLYKHALEMATSLGGAEASLTTRRPARTRPIERM